MSPTISPIPAISAPPSTAPISCSSCITGRTARCRARTPSSPASAGSRPMNGRARARRWPGCSRTGGPTSASRRSSPAPRSAIAGAPKPGGKAGWRDPAALPRPGRSRATRRPRPGPSNATPATTTATGKIPPYLLRRSGPRRGMGAVPSSPRTGAPARPASPGRRASSAARRRRRAPSSASAITGWPRPARTGASATGN